MKLNKTLLLSLGVLSFYSFLYASETQKTIIKEPFHWKVIEAALEASPCDPCCCAAATASTPFFCCPFPYNLCSAALIMSTYTSYETDRVLQHTQAYKIKKD